MRIAKNKGWLLSFLICFIAILGASCTNNMKPSWTKAYTVHNAIHNESWKTLWVRSDVYIETSWDYISLAASPAKVFIYGSADIDNARSIIALDGLSGDLVWQSNPIPPSTLFADQEGFYVGEAGGGSRILSLNLDNGQIRWSRNFPKSSGVESLLVYNDTLNVFFGTDKHIILNPETGENVFPLPINSPPFYKSTICGNIYQPPLYIGDTIYYRNNRGLELGQACNVDISSGDLRWKTDISIVSNVVSTSTSLYFLDENVGLSVVNGNTGQINSSKGIRFDNTPFILYDARREVGGYFLARDPQSNLLFVYLGDSRQLFAFQEK